MYCSWEAILLRVTTDHGDNDHLFNVVPGINQTFRVDVLEAGNMGKWKDLTLAWTKQWWLDNWLRSQIVFKAAALVGCSWCQNNVMVRLPLLTPVHWRKAQKYQNWTIAMEGSGPSSQLTGLKGFAANLLVSDTTALLWGQEEGFFNTTQY